MPATTQDEQDRLSDRLAAATAGGARVLEMLRDYREKRRVYDGTFGETVTKGGRYRLRRAIGRDYRA